MGGISRQISGSAKFAFERARGLVWVCDLANSTRALNDDASVDALEEFIPRLYWTAMQAVDAAGGVFVKWTGDGFLAWLETPLERMMGRHAHAIFTAAWHLTFLVNVTSLGIKAPQKLHLRHAVAYEPDALVMRITGSDGHVAQDLLGRGVVHAFRMASIACAFPGIISEARVVRAYATMPAAIVSFRRRMLTIDERLRFFKGERVGTDMLYATANQTPRRRSLRSVVTQGKRALAKLEVPEAAPAVATGFAGRMARGPRWASEVMREHHRFIEEELAGNLRKLLPVMEQRIGAGSDG
jgi:class 3 adenylate cyclase